MAKGGRSIGGIGGGTAFASRAPGSKISIGSPERSISTGFSSRGLAKFGESTTPRVSLTSGIGATPISRFEGRLKPISLPGVSGIGERSSAPAAVIDRSRLTNITVIPGPKDTSGRDFIRGLGEFHPNVSLTREGPATLRNVQDSFSYKPFEGRLQAPRTAVKKIEADTPVRRLPSTRPIGEIDNNIDHAGGTNRSVDVRNLLRQSESVRLPRGRDGGPELRANTVRILPDIHTDSAREAGGQSTRIVDPVPTNPNRLAPPVISLERNRRAQINAERLKRVQEYLKQQKDTYTSASENPSNISEVSPIAIAGVPASLQKELRVVTGQEAKSLSTGSVARRKLLVRQAKMAGIPIESPNNSKVESLSSIPEQTKLKGDPSNPQWNVLHMVRDTKFINALENHLREKVKDPTMWKKVLAFTAISQKGRVQQVIDIDENSEEEKRRKIQRERYLQLRRLERVRIAQQQLTEPVLDPVLAPVKVHPDTQLHTQTLQQTVIDASSAISGSAQPSTSELTKSNKQLQTTTQENAGGQNPSEVGTDDPNANGRENYYPVVAKEAAAESLRLVNNAVSLVESDSNGNISGPQVVWTALGNRTGKETSPIALIEGTEDGALISRLQDVAAVRSMSRRDLIKYHADRLTAKPPVTIAKIGKRVTQEKYNLVIYGPKKLDVDLAA